MFPPSKLIGLLFIRGFLAAGGAYHQGGVERVAGGRAAQQMRDECRVSQGEREGATRSLPSSRTR